MIRKLSHALLGLFLVLGAMPQAFAVAQKLTLDEKHSYVLWRIKHLGFSTQAGKWYVSGTVILDKDQPKDSKVNVTINMESLATGLPDLDEHLKGPLFFNTKKFPKATFVSYKVDVLSNKAARVLGMLTLHGVTKPLFLNVTLNKIGKNPITDLTTVGFSAHTEIKRSDFGINTLVPDVGNEVQIEIGAEAYEPKA